MSELSVTEARDELADLVNRVQYAGERTYLTRHGKRVVAIVPVNLVERYEQLEKQGDLLAAQVALKSGEEPVPWARVRSELPSPESSGPLAEPELRRRITAIQGELEGVQEKLAEVSAAIEVLHEGSLLTDDEDTVDAEHLLMKEIGFDVRRMERRSEEPAGERTTKR